MPSFRSRHAIHTRNIAKVAVMKTLTKIKEEACRAISAAKAAELKDSRVFKFSTSCIKVFSDVIVSKQSDKVCHCFFFSENLMCTTTCKGVFCQRCVLCKTIRHARCVFNE